MLVPLSKADQRAAAAAVAAILAHPQEASAGGWRAFFQTLTPQGRAALGNAKPRDVLETGLYCWRLAVPANTRARVGRRAVAAAFMLAAPKLTPYIAKAQAEARNA